MANSSLAIDVLFLLPVHMDELGSSEALVDPMVRGGVRTVVWAGGSVSRSFY